MKEPAFMPDPADVSLAMAYVPFQQWQDIYDETTALHRGTLFKQLDLPFLGEEAIPGGK